MARNAHPEQTVEKILDVATDLFMRKGYDDTSMQDIIDHLGGLSKGAIYHHFTSKEDLFDAVVNRIFNSVNPQKEARWNPTTASADPQEDTDTGFEQDNLTGLERMQREHDTQTVGPQLEAIGPITRSFNPERNPKLIGMQFLGLLKSASTMAQQVLEKGNEDGSLQVKHPQQVAEVQMLLANMWLYPLFCSGTSQELRARCDVYLTILRALGIPLQDRGFSDLIARWGSDCQPTDPTHHSTGDSTNS